MIATLKNTNITTVAGDITKQPDIDAIVNAANSQLRGGHGVCGAIFKAAGWDDLQNACFEHPTSPSVDTREMRCPTGDARLTAAFRLPNKGIIHAVGPIYNPAALIEGQNETELRGAYWNSLDIADYAGYESICFPAISCGIYRYPLKEAARIAMQTCMEYIVAFPETSLKEIRFVFIPFADGPKLQTAFEDAMTDLMVG